MEYSPLGMAKKNLNRRQFIQRMKQGEDLGKLAIASRTSTLHEYSPVCRPHLRHFKRNMGNVVFPIVCVRVKHLGKLVQYRDAVHAVELHRLVQVVLEHGAGLYVVTTVHCPK